MEHGGEGTPGRGPAGIRTVADLGTILGVWAHPDDEAYLMGGTAVLATAAGARVTCLTATAGEAGETADERRWPRARLAEIRRREMAASLRILGIEDHVWLGLPDGELGSIDPDHGAALVARTMERIRPDTVLTFGPDGMTGHPDHVAVGMWAHRAADQVPGSRLVLTAAKTAEWSDRFRDLNARVFPDGAPCTPADELALHVELVGDALDRKLRALAAQASQTAALSAGVGERAYGRWVRDEYWAHRRATPR